MRIGSLFSGYGGLDIAVETVLGGQVAWVSDNDPGASKILAHRYPGVPNLGDITTVDWGTVEPVDVLTAGFPCQDISHAGKRRGLRPDTRSGLWTHTAYAINQLQPRMVVIENVRGLLSAEAHSDLEPCPWCLGDGENISPLRALGAVLADLAECGYDARWHSLRAADVGAPHGRFRVFIVAYPGGEAVGLGAGLREGGQGRVGWGRSDNGGRPDTVADTGYGRESDGAWAARGPGRERPPIGTKPGGCGGATPAPAGGDRGGAETLSDTTGGGHRGRALIPVGESVERVAATRSGEVDWGDYTAAVARWEHILGRSAPEPTELGRTGQPRLSPAFVEWLMGLSPGWVTGVPGLSRNEQLKALGNGVVPQQAAAALRMLLEAAEVAA